VPLQLASSPTRPLCAAHKVKLVITASPIGPEFHLEGNLIGPGADIYCDRAFAANAVLFGPSDSRDPLDC